MKMMLGLLLIASTAKADEAGCLSEILYAEARGGSIEHVATLGQAAISKAQREKTTLCKLKGVARLVPRSDVHAYFDSVASELLAHKSTELSRGADHWDSHSRQVWPGRITKHIEGHKFYILAGAKQ